MNRFGLNPNWTALQLLDNLIVVGGGLLCFGILFVIVRYAFKRGLNGKETY